MERVIGIGGIFFKARDPQGMAAWYRKHLGVAMEDGRLDFVWNEKGATVWSLFPADTDYFAPSTAPFMINYRVANLGRMLEQLRGGGVKVEKVEDFEYGRFAWITDPEGNRIELWEPRGSMG
jgi:predicted enzyme related to lactoylglutathione lyase